MQQKKKSGEGGRSGSGWGEEGLLVWGRGMVGSKAFQSWGHTKHNKHNMSCFMGKHAFCICINKAQIRAFVFATKKVQSLFFLNLKFQASSHLRMYSQVCVGLGQKLVFIIIIIIIINHKGFLVAQLIYNF